jgi:putative transposase
MQEDLSIGTTVFPYFIKLEVFRYIDALVHVSLRETVLDGIVHITHKYKVRIHGWLVVPSAVKLIISSSDETVAMETVVDSFMNYTDRKLLQNVTDFKNETKRKWMLQLFENNRRSHRLMFWHPRYTLDTLDTEEAYHGCLIDMHENPVRAGIVWDAEHYMYSSAVDYIGDQPGLLPVEKITVKGSLSV